MKDAVAVAADRDAGIVPGKELKDFVTFFINDQMFGVPVLKVQDILTPDHIAPIPLAPPEVRGSINLRGRIVTVIDVRVCLRLEKRAAGALPRPAAGGGDRDQGDGPGEGRGSPGDGDGTDAAGEDGAAEDHGMGVTVEHQHELYTLLVDRVGDVISLSDEFYEDNPTTLDPLWREFALGVYRLEGELMVVLDVGRLLDIKAGKG